MPELPQWTDEELEAKLFDYHEGRLTPEARLELEQVMAARGEPLEAPADAVFDSGLIALRQRKAEAPTDFTTGVAKTIHERSAGRFFGKRTLGDRVPFSVLIVIALALLVAIAIGLWRSDTGSLIRRQTSPGPPKGGTMEPSNPR